MDVYLLFTVSSSDQNQLYIAYMFRDAQQGPRWILVLHQNYAGANTWKVNVKWIQQQQAGRSSSSAQ